jgi:hypothetical protein
LTWNSLGSIEAMTLRYWSGFSRLTVSITETPCSIKSSCMASRKASPSLLRTPGPRPFGFPDCPGFQGGIRPEYFIGASSVLGHRCYGIDIPQSQVGGRQQMGEITGTPGKPAPPGIWGPTVDRISLPGGVTIAYLWFCRCYIHGQNPYTTISGPLMPRSNPKISARKRLLSLR